MAENGLDYVPPSIETTQSEKPGLSKTKQLVSRYRTILDSSQPVNQDLVEKLTSVFGTTSDRLVRFTHQPSIAQNEMVVRTDPTNEFLDKVIEMGLNKIQIDVSDPYRRQYFPKELQEYYAQEGDQRLEQDLQELNQLSHLQRYLLNAINSTGSPLSYQGISQKLDKAVEIYQVVALKEIIKKGEDLATDDLLENNLPTIKDGLTADESVYANQMLKSIKTLLLLNIPDDLKKAYLGMLKPLDDELEQLVRKTKLFPQYTIQERVLEMGNSYYDKRKAVKNFSDVAGKGWEYLVINSESTRKIADIVSPVLVSSLFAGGYESWEGTNAAGMLYLLRDPKVLPSLIEHARRYGSTHTTNVVVKAIEHIISNPLDQADLDQVIQQMPPLYQRMIKNWFLDSDLPASKLAREYYSRAGGYSIAGMINQAEGYLARGDLLNIAIDIASSKNQVIDPDIIEAFFNGSTYTNISDLEKVLLDSLPNVASVIAKSRVVDWRIASQKVFNALITPPDGQVAFFPKVIAAEGLGLGDEDLAKLDKLYQLGDLRRGIMARTNFAEGLLFLASREDGSAIAKDILSLSTGANRDPERIRDIFMLLRSLDSFNVFAFTKRESLGETILDLKSKLVSVVAEKMELNAEDKTVLNERLFELMKSGVFEIIPHLLARFHNQGKENVAQVVKEIGRHIVLGDFQQWRNHLETSMHQLSVIPEEKQSLWTSSASDVVLNLGIKNSSETHQGAIDAIKRIASEAKAHILEVYKLDFSASGLNVLRQQQEDLIHQLKDNTRSMDERKELGERKRSIDNQMRMIEGLMALENLTELVEPVQLNKQIANIINSVNSFRGLDQAATDLNQINEVLSTQSELGNMTKIRAYDTDDPVALLKVGVEPRETCQSYRAGSYNHCLPAYVADANKRVINVENERGEVLGRSVIKLTHIIDEGDKKYPAILLEPIYTTSEIAPIFRGVVQIALEKARQLGAYLIIKDEVMVYTGTSNKQVVPIVQSEAVRKGMSYQEQNVQIFLPRSYNRYEYSDSLGGEQSYFDTYVNLAEAVIVNPSNNS